MAFNIRNYLPIVDARPPRLPAATQLIGPNPKVTGKLFKMRGQNKDYTGKGVTWEVPDYDFTKIIEAVDSDSYVKQAFNKYKELIWKEGWDIVGENDDAVAYLHERIDLMEFVMRKPFNAFLHDLGDQLVKFGNCFIVKVRGPIGKYVSQPLYLREGYEPVMGYYILPAETVKIQRDKHNRIIGYSQDPDRLVTSYRSGTTDAPEWKPDEVIHFAVDQPPGKVFGTPFMIAVMDDILGLRQLEEDVQNLVHKELFPLYKYTVGTVDEPADEEEIRQARIELEGMRTEAGLVLPGDRHDIEAVSVASRLDYAKALEHFMDRVCAGLGIAPHHLGIMNEGGNRSVTDRLDIALYDKVKDYQTYIADMIRIFMLTEMLLEAGYNPVTPPIKTGMSDRCIFRFREIDIDTQIKVETHAIAKWSANLASSDETRLALGLEPGLPEEDTLAALQARIDIDVADEQAQSQARMAPNPISGSTPTPPKKPDAIKPASRGRTNTRNNTRGVGNQIRPANQYGRRSSPNVRHALDDNMLTEMVELLDDDE